MSNVDLWVFVFRDLTGESGSCWYEATELGSSRDLAFSKALDKFRRDCSHWWNNPKRKFTCTAIPYTQGKSEVVWDANNFEGL